ncbi:nitric oxide synthase oxygenase [Haloarcula onubensis]
MQAASPEYGRLDRFKQAEQFVRHWYAELDRAADIEDRVDDIWRAIGRRGHYDHTAAELEHGARMAWHNSTRCIGRHFWDSLGRRCSRRLPGTTRSGCRDRIDARSTTS